MLAQVWLEDGPKGSTAGSVQARIDDGSKEAVEVLFHKPGSGDERRR